MNEWVPAFAIWFFFRATFIILVFVFLISGLDDLFLDMVYYVRAVYRSLFKRKQIKPVTREQLEAIPQKPIVIMIPAWNESAVIQRMLLNTAGVLDYKHVHIFVGVYPNDEATAQEAAKAREIFPNIEIVTTPAEGPTNKADCLNWIYQGICLYEKEHNIQFAAFVMQDAEDIVHPLWLKFVNYLIPRIDFIQLPVFPLESPWHQWVTGVYKDEFAENHTKDMRAREVLANALPSAGVGTALSRRTISWLARERRNQLFDIKSLTEDYLLGIQLGRLPGKKIFLQQWVEARHRKKTLFTRREKIVAAKQPVATREFFPNRAGHAIRQKSRWILGIALQGWSAGWTRSWGSNYMLYRDRKALVTNLVVVLGYAVALYWLGIMIHNQWRPAQAIPPLIENSEPYFKLAMAVMAIFLWRVLNRIAATTRLYGVMDGIMAIPRLFVANVINFCATVLAISRFVQSKVKGVTPAWGKTEHAWPSEDQLKRYRQKLGDLLVARRLITPEHLEKALAVQQKQGGRLGDILVGMGLLWEEDIVEAVATQEKKQAQEIDPYARPDLITLVPRDWAERYRIYPVDRKDDTLILAREDSEAPEDEEPLRALFNHPVAFRPTTKADIDFAIRRGYALSKGTPSTQTRIGPKLLEAGAITPETLKEALRRQKRHPEQRLGDILIDMKALSRATLEHHLKDTAS